MGISTLQIVILAIATAAAGVAAGWVVAMKVSGRRMNQWMAEAAAQTNDLALDRDRLANEVSKAQATIEALRSKVATKRQDLKSLRQKSKILARNVLALRDERERTKVKVTSLQQSLGSVRQRTLLLQQEFEKAGKFYQRELAKSFDKRKTVEEELKQAQQEQESFANMVESAVLEHGSPENMLAEARLRMGQLKVLERNVDKLEKENQQLRNDAVAMKRDFDAMQSDLKELEQLKIYNRQLVEAVESLENSRKQHEEDADRYRDQAAESERLSDTLRLKLADLEESFADIEKEQDVALGHARGVAEHASKRKAVG